MIVNAMERKSFLNGNKFTSAYTALKRNEDWKELSQTLNSSGGALKNVKCWQKCWSDKKRRCQKEVQHLQSCKSEGGRNDEKPLTPLDERILLLIGLDAAEGLDIVESESMPKVYVIPRVDENPASPTSGTVSNELNTQPYTQEFNKADFVEYLLPDTLDCVVNVEECNHSASLPLSRTPQSKTPKPKMPEFSL
ncbi:hypothetical protein AVEN_107900-1 [Araneus ventricosus]|uniref:Regulatory protein zeste n=1 Tax=Araneus ventricosus TaxID=182803 RepID=A0A4Y2W6S2_ARAVE|nr:hypothetical protein AVEN_107900-1 [Araneus ventricosus]